GGDTRTIVLDDFNGDGKADLAFSNYPSADVSVLTSSTPGDFGADRRSDGVDFSSRILSADFDGDGVRDLIDLPSAAPIGTHPRVAILLGHKDKNTGRGDGAFKPPQLLTTGLPAGTVYGAVGDFNGDGKTDFAVFSAGGLRFEVHLGH